LVDAAALVAGFPGPAAWVARDGTVRAANEAGRQLAAALGARTLAALGALAAPCSEEVSLPGEPDAGAAAQAIELAVVPIAHGVLLLGHDLSLAANLRRALVDSRKRYKDLVEVSSDFAWEVNGAGRFDFVSPRGALGFSASALMGRAADSLLFAMPGLEPESSPFATRRPIEQVETWLVGADGEPACVLVSAVPIVDAEGGWAGARGVWRDVTEDRTWRAALDDARNREQMLAHIVRTMRDEVEPAAMLDATARTTARALGADGARLWRIAPDGGLEPAAAFGAEPPADVAVWAQEVMRAGRDGAFAMPDLPGIPARMLAASAG
jgi:PAS domain S-box-containing protein